MKTISMSYEEYKDELKSEHNRGMNKGFSDCYETASMIVKDLIELIPDDIIDDRIIRARLWVEE
jgi:hypothetical protein